ncbi:hypothetical protein MUB04_14335 [Acinetobacter indicus]|uniref:hypothetical protein n=1 Tax=Acinetobacter TaxID=469 RepID=UPI0015D1C87C|nr:MULTISPECIES: hypothetical protein [Acinetobacter]MCP0917709.1 hypothetical protein [Acinetobacter indicus]
MNTTANDLHTTHLYSVEEFLSNSVSVDEGYGSELFAAINTLTSLTVYEQTQSVMYYFNDDKHPYHRACTYQPLVRSVNESIEEILTGMELSDPKKVVRNFSWWEKFNCVHKQAETDYLSGVKNIRFHKVLMERNLAQLRQALGALREIHKEMTTALPFLQKLVEQGFAFIEQQEQNPEPIYEKQLDRFRRQLKNTVAFQSMAQMNIKQVEQYIDVAQNTLDRANEISTILIPIWQTLYNNQNSENHVDKAKIEEVAKLHERVIESLKNL